MVKGQVLKARAGRFTVGLKNGMIDCFAKGNLKIKSDGIVTGDYVEVEEKTRTVVKVLERSSYFIRPNIANIDAVNIVVASPPKPDFLMLDKLILCFLSQGIEVIFSVNKSDLNTGVYDEILANYGQIGCDIVQVSAHTGEGIDNLKSMLSGKLVAFAGQSAVGKSSLVNAMFGLKLRTDDVSEKTQRGRHTTTAATIYEFGDIRVADTPGFSVIIPDILPEEAALFYPEYFELLPECRFRGCTHTEEPDCAVIKAVADCKLNKNRYERYKQIYKELKEIKENRF